MSGGKRLERLEARLAQLERENAELRLLIAELEAENARLRGETSKSSRNSGKPPSSDSPAQRSERPKRAGSGRKPGGQPGHEGHQRTLVPAEKVTRSRDRFPKRCSCCHHELSRVPHGDPIRHQTVEVPKIEPDITENRLHAVVCPECLAVTRAKLPRGVPRAMCGPNLMALITLLVGVYQLSRRDAVTCVGDVLGIQISLGALGNVERRVADMLAPAQDEASVLGPDATRPSIERRADRLFDVGAW